MATPSGVRQEMSRAWHAYLRGEIEIGECKGAFYCLGQLGRLMAGPEVEHLVDDVRQAFEEHERSRRINGHGQPAAAR